MPRRIYTRPADFKRHGYTQGCRGCAWIETKIGPRVPQTEECRQRIEEEIGADEADDRAKKVKERFYHYAAQEVEEGDVHGKDPRQEVEPKEDAAPELAEEEAMDTGADKYDIGTPGKMSAEDEGLGSDDFADGSNTTSDRRLHTPVRLVAVKRRGNIHDDEPETKKIIRDDDDENMEGDQGLNLDEVRVRQENQEIVCRHFRGKNLHDVYSNERHQLEAGRQSMELLNRQLLDVDVMEVFSFERVVKLCKEYGLRQGR